MRLTLGGFGVTFDVDFGDDAGRLLPIVSHALAPAAEQGDVHAELVVRRDSDGYRWVLGGIEGAAADGDVTASLRTAVDRYLAEHSPTHVFVHAGVVVHRARAIVLPGTTHAGKSTAIEALVRAGARYYSDEFAPIDRAGLVHAFPRPLSRRVGVDAFDVAYDGDGPPVEVGTVALARYSPGSAWDPSPVERAGAAVLAVLAHTVSARIEPERALDHLARALDGARVLAGDRGEADDFALSLLSS